MIKTTQALDVSAHRSYTCLFRSLRPYRHKTYTSLRGAQWHRGYAYQRGYADVRGFLDYMKDMQGTKIIGAIK